MFTENFFYYNACPYQRFIRILCICSEYNAGHQAISLNIDISTDNTDQGIVKENNSVLAYNQ